jgi:hypothetical protein
LETIAEQLEATWKARVREDDKEETRVLLVEA